MLSRICALGSLLGAQRESLRRTNRPAGGLGHFGRGHLGRGHYGRGHLGRGHYGRGHFGRGHFGPLIQRILYN